MKPEPLKGKLNWRYFDSPELDHRVAKDEDIRSAVEWLIKKIKMNEKNYKGLYTYGSFLMLLENQIEEAFEDVMKYE